MPLLKQGSEIRHAFDGDAECSGGLPGVEFHVVFVVREAFAALAAERTERLRPVFTQLLGLQYPMLIPPWLTACTLPLPNCHPRLI